MGAGPCNRDMASDGTIHIPVYRVMDTELTAVEHLDA